MGIIMAVTYLTLKNFKQIPHLFVGWFWFLGTLMPAIGFVQTWLWPAMADRWA